MIESLLKELGERHFEILWRYESTTNSIVIQMDKRNCHQWYRLARKVTLDDFRRIRTNQFEDTMVRFLKEMAQELEYQIKVAPEPMKGEDNDQNRKRRSYGMGTRYPRDTESDGQLGEIG
ncbi:hypothetical protein NE556_02125 [[Clostridium] symbiosum]|uniref:hypothetical protein n=1 Tax=Clostridium symbiosum TaxID=1512 RepID=UPI00210D56DD|nr:hypothetical protein [[Clostridium] symbiosum]MCQ4834001.1 hypothetical protein [[Clostridium] symbiosum]